MNVDNEGPPTVENLDMLTNNLYTSANSEVRIEAENRLAYYFPTFASTDSQELNISPLIQKKPPVSVYSSIKTPLDSISFLFWYLNNTRNDYSLFFASQRIKVIVIKFAFSFNMAQKKDLDKTRELVLMESIVLQKNIFLFSFVGFQCDESSDDIATIQLPTSWRTAFDAPALVDSYFIAYKDESASIQPLILELLVYFASIRRTFFTDETRKKFTMAMVQHITNVIDNSIGLGLVENYHHMCRLLSRFRSTHTLIDMENDQEFEKFLDTVTGFSITGLSLWEIVTCYMASLLTLATKSVSDDGISDS
ncbi:Exportin-7 [Smittium culicis]|uniref:Exportin-7 n=1 Tax=Smittium culicis TaxID=133412 RepID=A0A1R1XXJ4_9FUNG|nr:Exportin-7 [Smittium culicis]OMJ19407.1 Exportin-7 [Smittium culicis]